MLAWQDENRPTAATSVSNNKQKAIDNKKHLNYENQHQQTRTFLAFGENL